MRRIGCTFGIVLVLVTSTACDTQERNALKEAGARLNEDRLFAYADEHLSDDALAAAVPEGFDFTGVKRNGYDRHGNEWVTVGVRMEGPVQFARAIFYVHPDEAKAHEMFERQSHLDHDVPGERPHKHAKPWSENELELDNRCHVRVDSLFWCHAYQANVYLVTQSAAGWPTGRDITLVERKAAARLLTSFGAYLQEEIPGD